MTLTRAHGQSDTGSHDFIIIKIYIFFKLEGRAYANVRVTKESKGSVMKNEKAQRKRVRDRQTDRKRD